MKASNRCQATDTLSKSWGFFLEFHMPYHAMRHGPIDTTNDPRKILGKRLRRSRMLPLGLAGIDEDNLYYHEAQTSSLSWGCDEFFWTEIFLVDTYFGSEHNMNTYLRTPGQNNSVEDPDPTLGGRPVETPVDPRRLFLLKLDVRTKQVANEYGALVDTFNKRMELYVCI